MTQILYLFTKTPSTDCVSLLSAALHGIYLYSLALMTFIAAAAKMAAEEGPKPRVNGSMLPKHTGQIVSVVAKYLGVG